MNNRIYNKIVRNNKISKRLYEATDTEINLVRPKFVLECTTYNPEAMIKIKNLNGVSTERIRKGMRCLCPSFNSVCEIANILNDMNVFDMTSLQGDSNACIKICKYNNYMNDSLQEAVEFEDDIIEDCDREPEVGDIIRIIKMDDDNGKDISAARMRGKEGEITYIDSKGQLHGTWGGLAVIPEIDRFVIIK